MMDAPISPNSPSSPSDSLHPILGGLSTPSFWVELVVRNGVPALIAVYLVFNLVAQQQQSIRGLQDSMVTLSSKLDRLSDKLENARK